MTTANNKKGRKKLLSEIFGGDVLMSNFLQREWKLIVMMIVLTLLYIDSRYACEIQLLEIDRLKKELTDVQYDALTRNSELMERSRQSKIEEFIEKKQIDLQIATNPPYLIK